MARTAQESRPRWHGRLRRAVPDGTDGSGEPSPMARTAQESRPTNQFALALGDDQHLAAVAAGRGLVQGDVDVGRHEADRAVRVEEVGPARVLAAEADVVEVLDHRAGHVAADVDAEV